MTRSRLRLVAGLAALLMTASMPVLAQASDDFDAIDQADVLQKQAIKAAREGNWKVARQLAEEVLTLDVSFATAPSRLVLARALQQEENYAGALYEIRQLERLEGVVDRLLDEVQSLRSEIEAMKAREERQASRPASSAAAPDRNVGIGLVAGGVAPVFVGGLFIGTDIHYASQNVESGTWAVMGSPILAAGVILEVVGAALITRGGKTARTAQFQIDGVSLGADQDRVWVGVTGRF